MAWHDHLAIHPACAALPAMTPDELLALSDDIRTNNLQEKIKLIRYRASYAVIDRRSRLDALEMIGPIQVFDGNTPNRRFFEVIDLEGRDPLTFVLSMNVHRRHVTLEQRRDLIAKLLKARPELSDRAIGSMTKADHKTVAPIRADLEQGGEIPHHQSRLGKDGVKQRSAKSGRKLKCTASSTRRKMQPQVIETSYEEIEPCLPFDLPRAASLNPKALPTTNPQISHKPILLSFTEQRFVVP